MKKLILALTLFIGFNVAYAGSRCYSSTDSSGTITTVCYMDDGTMTTCYTSTDRYGNTNTVCV